MVVEYLQDKSLIKVITVNKNIFLLITNNRRYNLLKMVRINIIYIHSYNKNDMMTQLSSF